MPRSPKQRLLGCSRRASALAAAIVLVYIMPQAALAFDECSSWFRGSVVQGGRTDPLAEKYWLTIGPSRLDPASLYDTSRLRPLDVSKGWAHCGPLSADVVSRVSIISLDSSRQSKICKVDIRTLGGQSYSFGEHCTNGVPKTLTFYPGERVLKASLAFLPIPKINSSGVGGQPAPNKTVTLGSMCIITTYGGILRSGNASCDTAKLLQSSNSGILAGIGGTTELDDFGQEYITSLYFIFHPWPDQITYDLSSYKIYGGEPTESIAVQDTCQGNKAFCRFADTTTQVECSVSVTRSASMAVSSSDTVSLSLGLAASQTATQAFTQGKETGQTLEVGLSTSTSSGRVLGVSYGFSTEEGVEVAEGVTVAKEVRPSEL